MDVTLDGGENDPPLHLLGLSLQGLLEHIKCRFGGLRAHQKLRQENGSLLKPFSHFVEGGDQIPVDQVEYRRVLKGLSGRVCGALRHSPEHALSKTHSRT